MIYELFYLWDELDLLDIKLHELDDVIDKFVFMEFPTSLLQKPQPLHFQENKDRFTKFEHKIIHLISDEDPRGLTGYGLYANRINRLGKWVQDNASPEDIIIFSDPDVIFHRQLKEQLNDVRLNFGFCKISVPWYFYYMDMRYTVVDYGFPWITRYKNIGNNFMGLHKIIGNIQNQGWHFSKLGGADKVLSHLSGYPHQEMLTKNIMNKDTIQYKIDNGYAWDDPKCEVKVIQQVKFDPNMYPQYVLENKDIYRKYFKGDIE